MASFSACLDAKWKETLCTTVARILRTVLRMILPAPTGETPAARAAVVEWVRHQRESRRASARGRTALVDGAVANRCGRLVGRQLSVTDQLRSTSLRGGAADPHTHTGRRWQCRHPTCRRPAGEAVAAAIPGARFELLQGAEHLRDDRDRPSRHADGLGVSRRGFIVALRSGWSGGVCRARNARTPATVASITSGSFSVRRVAHSAQDRRSHGMSPTGDSGHCPTAPAWVSNTDAQNRG